ncbi:PREDICTED: von Willebrand factor A domain-containing protein 7-like isoform X1 [Branchiostoma belcheri]|uniref:von Willebrand factor A domain-containing protein 7-like isoform X1 n=1 Tax=Branchiostoma belcheri TaxID=7741 RepID=A0A6P5A8J9_BRABE|nr:PREDICTED: von Willebrand factor A domain-containing protein 7-like isoform X1 [Branchiostoma belcheri]
MARSVTFCLPLLVVFILGLFSPSGRCFIPMVGISLNPTDQDSDDNWSHGAITRRALLNVAADFQSSQLDCDVGDLRDVKPDRIFQEISRLFRRCYGQVVSAARFYQAALQIETANGCVDLNFATKKLPSAHFDAERFVGGNERLLELRTQVLTAIGQGEYEAARVYTGQLLHTLQDFYSHSNWVEMGHKEPNAGLAVPGADIGRVAAPDTPTCEDCSKTLGFLWYKCEDNIRAELNQQGLLTSGYSSNQKDLNGNPVNKPEGVGKCSHGGHFDGSKDIPAAGGINKDTKWSLFSPHSDLHNQAAQLAVKATEEFFRSIRTATGDAQFANFLNLNSGSTLCFVIDTTASMDDDIAASKERALEIISSRVGSPTAPSNFILVPFNDPVVGPAVVTNNPEEFKAAIGSLEADGGGDSPEYSLGAVQIALARSLPGSTIFVFTDAEAKDAELLESVTSLGIQKNIKVTFFLSGTVGRRRSERSRTRRESRDRDTYLSIAQSTGGQVLDITKSEVFQTTKLVDLVVTSAEVNILQIRDAPAGTGDHVIPVDLTMSDVIIQVTGLGAELQVLDPTGVLQETGENATVSVEVQLSDVLVVRVRDVTPGVWHVVVLSAVTYDLRVTAQSSVDFMYAFVDRTANDTEHPGVCDVDGRPVSGQRPNIRVNMVGSDPSLVQNVTSLDLVGSDGAVLQVLSLQENEPLSEYFAVSPTLPQEPFKFRVRGYDAAANAFQRVIPTMVQTATCRFEITTDLTTLRLVPGGIVDVTFTLYNAGQYGIFTISAKDDKGFVQSLATNSLPLDAGDPGYNRMTLAAPALAEFGTTTTVTLTAQSSGAYNFVVFRITVLPPEQDFIPPTCEVVAMVGTCRDLDASACDSRTFTVTTAYRDQGYGLRAISPRAANNNFTWTLQDFQPGLTNQTITANFTASCCQTNVEFVVTDLVGNYDVCRPDLAPPLPKQAANTAVFVFIGLGILLFLILLIILIVLFVRHRRRRKYKAQERYRDEVKTGGAAKVLMKREKKPAAAAAATRSDVAVRSSETRIKYQRVAMTTGREGHRVEISAHREMRTVRT